MTVYVLGWKSSVTVEVNVSEYLTCSLRKSLRRLLQIMYVVFKFDRV